MVIHFLENIGSKVKTVKMVRNKLSDAFLKPIIKKLGGISTLNLAQNQLT